MWQRLLVESCACVDRLIRVLDCSLQRLLTAIATSRVRLSMHTAGAGCASYLQRPPVTADAFSRETAEQLADQICLYEMQMRRWWSCTCSVRRCTRRCAASPRQTPTTAWRTRYSTASRCTANIFPNCLGSSRGRQWCIRLLSSNPSYSQLAHAPDRQVLKGLHSAAGADKERGGGSGGAARIPLPLPLGSRRPPAAGAARHLRCGARSRR